MGGWVTVSSPNDISGLRRPKNVRFLIVAKFAKKIGQK